MVKKMTIDDLAGMVKRGFDDAARSVNKCFDDVHKRCDGIDKRLDRIENILSPDHVNRVGKLEDTVLQLKVKVGIR